MRFSVSVSLAALLLVLSGWPARSVLAQVLRAAAHPNRPAPIRAASPLQNAGPTVLTPTVYLPVTFGNYDPTYVNPFGVAMYDGVDDTLGLAAMQTAGSRWATTFLIWAAVEPNPPDINGVHTYDWSSVDAMASRAQAARVRLFALFSGNPAWAAQYAGGPVTNTVNLVDFTTALAERYDGDGDPNDAPGHPIINDWSFYAEPDNRDSSRLGKGLWGENPAGYAAMLAAISPAMHAANPNARVMIGGLAYDWFTTDPPPPGGPFVQSFLGNVLATLNTYPGGASHYLDAVAFHYYPISTARWPTIREKAQEIRSIMNAGGAGALPLIVPEMGYWSDLPSSESIQARTLAQMYVRGLSVGVQQMSWFGVFDHGISPSTESHGLFRNGNLATPKLAYAAYATLTAELTWFHYDHALALAGVEGYVFRLPSGETKTVLWATAAPANATFVQTCARRVDLLGSATQVADGGAGDLDLLVNGRVKLAVAVNQPVYVGACH